jgi:hypothetical protein
MYVCTNAVALFRLRPIGVRVCGSTLAMDFRFLPYDTQRCKAIFNTFRESGKEVELVFRDVATGEFTTTQVRGRGR